MLRNLILSAAAAALVAGLLTAALQQVTTTPLILQAERYESGAAAAGHDHSGLGLSATIAPGGEDEAWAPGGGVERTAYTSLATLVIGVGFALALLGAMTLAGARIDAR